MIHLVQGNIFTAEVGQIICHQVNCQGKMGKGIAKTIRERYPPIYSTYQDLCERYASYQLLGRVYIDKMEDGRVIANIFAQDEYGKDARYTNYEALAQCLEKLAIYSKENGMSIALPYGIGCNNAGGNWNIVKTMIEEYLVDLDAYIYDNRRKRNAL